MDPLSISASILTIVGAAEATRKGIQRLSSLRHAQAQLDAVNNEVCMMMLI